jgi:hypothetical protein
MEIVNINNIIIVINFDIELENWFIV